MLRSRLTAMIMIAAAVAGCGPAGAQRRFARHRLPPIFLARPHFHHFYIYRPPLFEPPFIEGEPPPEPRETEPLIPPLPLSQGMMITVTKLLSDKPESDGGKDAPTIDRPKQAAEQLAACWSPPLPAPGETVEVSIRFAFNSLGSVQGTPRITYVKAGQGMSADAVRESIAAAVKACTPLHFAASMASSMPGYPLSVRFIGRRANDGG